MTDIWKVMVPLPSRRLSWILVLALGTLAPAIALDAPSLFVDTDPMGARIRVDGVLRPERTPALVRGLSPGHHEVSLWHEGFAEASQTVEVGVKGPVPVVEVDLTPESLVLAYLDWAIHLAGSPGKCIELLEKFLGDSMKCLDYGMHSAINPEYSFGWNPLPQDRRFSGSEWQQWPYNFMYQTFLSIENWWQSATTGIHGVSCHNENVVSFVGRQALDPRRRQTRSLRVDMAATPP